MKETFYFSHDYNARSDNKIQKLLAKHGMEGYGIYWAIIEDLYNNANALRMHCECIAYSLHSHCEVIEDIIKNFDLFIIDGDFFGSPSVERRLNEKNEKSVKAKQSASYRWNKKDVNANAMRTQCVRNAIKESKVNNINKDFFKFYLSEYEKIENKKTKSAKNYKAFFELMQKDKILLPLTELELQFSYDDFLRLIKKTEDKEIELLPIIRAIANDENYYKNKKSLPAIAEAWINRSK